MKKRSLKKSRKFIRKKTSESRKSSKNSEKIHQKEPSKILLSGVLKKRYVALFIIYSVAIAVNVFLILNLVKNINKEQQLYSERNSIQKQINYWEKIVSTYKGYRDAYYNLAILEYKLGDKNQAKFYIDKALSLDPNFKEARELEKELDR